MRPEDQTDVSTETQILLLVLNPTKGPPVVTCPGVNDKERDHRRAIKTSNKLYSQHNVIFRNTGTLIKRI